VSARAQVGESAAKLGLLVRTGEERLLTQPLARYGVAVSRILAGVAYVGILLTNIGHRDLLFGPASGWVESYREVSPQGVWTGYVAALGDPWFTLYYLLVIAAGAAFVLGWHGRLAGVLLLLGAVPIIEMNPLVGDQGDNILRVGLLLTLLTDCCAVWSLDARRRTRRGEAYAGRGRWSLSHQFTWVRASKVLIHNGAVIALALQLVIIYVSAGMFKTGGGAWKFGTAIAYPLQLDEYRVWPFLNDLVVSTSVGVWFMTYFAVFLQLYFPVLLINKITRRVALVAVLGLHLGIAVLMALPWFSLAMFAFDGIFVSTATYLALEGWLVPRLRNVRQSLGRRLVRST